MSAPIPELTSITDGIAKAFEQQPETWARLQTLDRWTVYTDGSAPIVNPGGPIGFASIFLLDKTTAFEVSGGTAGRTTDPPTSNNRAEISGVVAIMELLYKAHLDKLTLPREVEIVCDSQYVINCAEGRWKKLKNRDLWGRYDQLASVARAQKVKVTFRWTKAHVGTVWNERADVLAKEAALGGSGMMLLDEDDSTERAKAAPPTVAKQQPSEHHYLLRLYAVMTGRTKSEGYYELRTPQRSRQETVLVPNAITLDEAEYHTLNAALADIIATLETAGRTATDFKLCVESSRDLMLKQIQGVYGVKSERLIPLHSKTKGLIRRFGGVDWAFGDKLELKDLARSASTLA